MLRDTLVIKTSRVIAGLAAGSENYQRSVYKTKYRSLSTTFIQLPTEIRAEGLSVHFCTKGQPVHSVAAHALQQNLCLIQISLQY